MLEFLKIASSCRFEKYTKMNGIAYRGHTMYSLSADHPLCDLDKLCGLAKKKKKAINQLSEIKLFHWQEAAYQLHS